MHFFGQAFNLPDRFGDYLVTGASLAISFGGSLGSMLGIARDFLYGGGHFMHGGRYLVGFNFLAVDPGAGFFGNGRQLFGGAGDLRDAVADTGDQVAQGRAHALDALLQHTQFVAAGDAQVVGQVAGGDLLDHGQGLAQRTGDLPGDDHGGQYTDQQRQQGGGQLQGAGLSAFNVATVELDLVQGVAGLDDVGTLNGHLLT
ncbi:hypothetical protein D3C79_792820 [compost metagenome]